MKNRKIEWTTLLFGIFWTVYTVYIFTKYMNGTLESFRTPKIIALIHDTLGFIPGSILQFLLGIVLIFVSFKKVETNSIETDLENDEIQ